MAKEYYDNSDEGQRFQPGTTAEGEAVDEKFDEVAAGFQEAEKDTRRALKFPFEEGMESQEFSGTAFQRRNRVLGFDANGDLALVSGFYNRGDWQPDEDYFLNDVVRDPETTNLYVLIVAEHTSGSEPEFDNEELWYLAIDADTVRVQKIAAEEARDAAEGYRDLARDWASKDPGAVDGTAYQSAKTYALAAADSESATRAMRDAVADAEDRIEDLEQSATSAEATATQAATNASASADVAAESESNIQGVESNVTTLANQVETDAQDARDAADDAESVSQRINDTTTMDFINFELDGPNLIAHFAGYSDADNFTINAAGELEVNL